MPDHRSSVKEHPLHVVSTESAPAEFIPLRLTLEPSGMCLEVTKAEVILGRHSQADVRLPLPDVSRRHCRLTWSGGLWRIVDLQSLNGIYVNDQALTEAVLQPGDTVRIGGFTFLVGIDPQATTAYPEPPLDGQILRSIAEAIPTTEQFPRRRAS